MALWNEFQSRIDRVLEIRAQILQIEKKEIGSINHEIERLRLKQRSLELKQSTDVAKFEAIDARRAELNAEYEVLQAKLLGLYNEINRDSFIAEIADGRQVEIPMAKIVRAFLPNDMGIGDKLVHYAAKVWESYNFV